MKIPIEVSARHVHLSKKAVEILFGKNYQLKFKKSLSQLGQFVCEEKVDIVGPRNQLTNVAVLGPIRCNTQVEISITDSIRIGKKYTIRDSGDLKGSESCILVGPVGKFEISEGLIVARRHIHVNSSDASKIGVVDGQIVKVKVDSRYRSLIYDDVLIRVNDKFSLAMHIDTDESNALNYEPENFGEIIL